MNKYMWIVFKKELKDTFRDRKTIFSSIIIPILIFPILALAIGSGTSKFIEEGEKPIDIAIISEENYDVVNFLKNHQGVSVKEVENPNEALEELEIKAIVKINRDFDKNIQKGLTGGIEIIYDESSQKSSMAEPRLRSIIKQYADNLVVKRLKAKGINPNILNAVDIKSSSLSVEEDGYGIMLFSMMLPMLLTIWSAAGGIPSATDLGAGEKERQTLEPLLTTNASRTSIILGKYFTVVTAGIIATIASLIGFILATQISPDFLGTGVILPIKSIIVIALFCIGLTLTFSGLELAISFFARNFKEAQTYLTPITIILLIPAYFTMYLDGKAIPDSYFYIPVINIISIIKEALVSIYNPIHIITVSIWTIIYISIAIFITVKMFNKESVIFRN
ncbi:ABC transporter permease [Caldisalinibacter kiritimatiensis]|uniref:ABC-2 type transporter n=1 Tax=Caldisalinibacter kiritimatiensis TaxID=1304284 RepID=R1CCQ4_9FIRM|nr:ABC transporter permease [Caldisalinibacter kiritimatiensis]EOD00070.1 ABC-2 type transporter [Caldisalinibacter kiritimatiensis]